MTQEARQGAPLLERELELDQIGRLLGAASTGRGGLLYLEGHAGIGKTRLLEWAIETAPAAGLAALPAHGSELERDFPFGLVRQLLEPALARLDPDERDEVLSGPASHGRALLLGEHTSGEATGYSVVHGLYWITATLAQRGPLVLVVDDVHWSDRLSLRYLLHLTQRLRQLPVAIVAAGRPAVEPRSEHDLVAHLGAHGAASARRLSPLSSAAVATLVEHALPEAEPPFVAACADVTQGNPFLVRELLRELDDEGVPPTAENARVVGALAPEAITRALLVRLARLDDSASQVARAVAVLGDDATLRRVARVAEVDPETCSRAVDALAVADVLAPGEPVAFSHPIIASSLYADMRTSERAAGHALAARMLMEDGVPAERAAPHLLAAPRGGERWLVSGLEQAARRAMGQGAPESAVTFLRRALEEPPPPEARPRVLLALGHAEAAAGEPGADSRLEHALDLIEDPGMRAEALLAIGRNLHACGRTAEAAQTFDRALAEIGDDHELTLTLHSAYAAAATFEPSLRGSAFERLGPALDEHADHPPQARRVALANLAGARSLEGRDRAGAVALALEAWDDGAMLREGSSEEQSIWGIVATLQWADRPGTALAMVDAVVEDARARGSVHGLATGLVLRGATHWYLGRVPGAVADLEPAVETRRHGWELYLPAAYGFLLQGLLELGRIDQGEAVIAEVAADLDRWREGSASVARYLHAHGQWLLARGDAASALESFLDAGRTAVGALQAANPATLPWRSAAAIAALRAGHGSRARELAEEELELAQAWGAPRAVGVSLRALGLVTGGTAGLELLREAASTLERSEARLVHARALADLGAALRRAGKRTDARAPLREALDLAVRAGSTRVADAAQHELLAAGGRPRRPHLSGLGALTPSELRVARMAAQGLTNREIAEVLFVTVKAVQFHLTSVYRKLEIEGRRDLAGALGAPEAEEAA